ncbi:early transcribed membrane protein [Plasmodium vinckei vinckei]|uniref:Early transcribed membrane protein n=1 Tax=Plasmodium vinckei vinckei TaxID=54757 RepID=A0A449BRZ7_PLAVN|nr:early transcribed membrane protein [Plasmodium vinckei vinckei]VEV56205.1 early transcribed membrane protein [Plasmodium vinckei vinckei]
MKLTKALYFIAFLLAINVFVPGSNNYVEAKPNPKGGNSLANKIKNNKAALISTILATLAIAAAGTTFGVMHLKNKGNSKKKTAGGNNGTEPSSEYIKRQTIHDYDPKMYLKIY